MDEQEKYKDYVLDYLSRCGISLPKGVNTCYTADAKETDRFIIEYAQKNDKGEYVDTGIVTSEKVYFIGDYRIGFIVNTEILNHFRSEQAFKHTEIDDKKVFLMPKSHVIQCASLITYFKIVRKPMPKWNG